MMPLVRVPNIKAVKVKGRTYYYHRRTGERLPDDLPTRVARAVTINEGIRTPDCSGPPEDSVEAVVRDYLASPEFADLSEASQRAYERRLADLRRALGECQIASITRRHVLRMRDAMKGTPATANMMVKVTRVLMGYALDRELRPDNPARGVKALKAGPGHRTWTQADIERFVAYAEPDMVFALALGVNTGQRLGDVLAMSWADYDGSAIRVVQSKTGERLWIPAAKELRVALDARERSGLLILNMKRTTFNAHWRKAILAADLDGLTFHGLRYTAAANLAEAGCDVRQIASITGHRSLAMLQKYTRGADQKRLACAAILKLERTEQKQKPENRKTSAGKPLNKLDPC